MGEYDPELLERIWREFDAFEHWMCLDRTDQVSQRAA